MTLTMAYGTRSAWQHDRYRRERGRRTGPTQYLQRRGGAATRGQRYTCRGMSNADAYGTATATATCYAYTDGYSHALHLRPQQRRPRHYADTYGNAKLHTGLRIHIGDRKNHTGNHRHRKPLR